MPSARSPRPRSCRTDATQGTVVAAVVRQSPRRGPVALVLGDPSVDQFLVDRPETGPVLVPFADVSIRADRSSPVGSRSVSWPSTPDAAPRCSTTLTPVMRVHGAASSGGWPWRTRSWARRRQPSRSAVEHARRREQFGKPIGTFQAVRHLLAWALTDCAAVEAVADAALRLDTESPARFDEMVKALAGRNGRRACERTLQVLGAIGFTAEFDHHHHHSRVLTLDSVLGSSTELTAELGAWLREGRADPGIAGAMLASMLGVVAR